MGLYNRYCELVRIIAFQNLATRYRGSLLGTYWSLFNPLIMTGIYTALFGAEFASYYNDSLLSYAMAAFLGLIVIHFFSASTTQALTSIVSNGTLLNKIKLPLSIFPVGIVTANTVQFTTGVLPLVLFLTLLKSGSWVNMCMVILPFIALIIICLGIALIVSGLYVFFRDLQYFYELITFSLWISSPVFYPPDIVPEAIQPFLKFNPLFIIIDSIRQIVFSSHVPYWSVVFSSFSTALLILAIGLACFHCWKTQYMDLL
ncbi:MAG: ABC transporter permease [Spirulina sp. SIO3F2]|nr:ABC transporter permease [Spirulina sp. SIO3F2]